MTIISNRSLQSIDRLGEPYTVLIREAKESDRCAYSDTAEISLYIDEVYRGKGIGKKLMSEIIEAGRRSKLHTVIARIAGGNEISVQMHKKAGFTVIGNMKEVGRKCGKLLDVLLMQKIY